MRVGVTALPMTVLDAFTVADVSKIPLVEPVVRRDIGFVTRRGRDPSPAARKLMETIERPHRPTAMPQNGSEAANGFVPRRSPVRSHRLPSTEIEAAISRVSRARRRATPTHGRRWP